MGRRSLSGIWKQAVRRQVSALTRRALRASKKVVKRAIKAPTNGPTQRLVRNSNWLSGVATSAAGRRRYHLYKPASKPDSGGFPLLVMLHGCSQDARSFASSTRMNNLAEATGFMVLYPEQDRLSNIQSCWNWFDTRAGRAQREIASIHAVIDKVCATSPIDKASLVVAGLSAGASMAAMVALDQPERFLAVAMHSGVGPGMADSTATALAAMRGRTAKAPPGLNAPPARLPPLLVIQGERDTVVDSSNGRLTAGRWAEAAAATESPPRVVQRGKRYAMTLCDWKKGRRVFVTLADVTGLGHAWSGGAASQPFSDPAGPDASRMIWSFAQRERMRRDGLANIGSPRSISP